MPTTAAITQPGLHYFLIRRRIG